MDQPTHEIEAFFAGDITVQQLGTLEAWLNADPAHARAFLEQVHFRELLSERIREQRNDNRAVLAELARLEAAEHPGPVTLTDPDERVQHEDKGSISTSELTAVGGYLLRQLATPKRLAYAAVAAVLLIAGAVLILQLEPSQPKPAVVKAPIQAPAHASAQPESPAQVVAALTAQHDAEWSSTALRIGDELVAGQPLTLIHGFAEITTSDGAVAILQAPCTIQMGDSPNAMRLIRGKLVGICETPSSQGFVVSTPRVDITDLGTRFGVALDQMGESIVHVFEGRVATKSGPSDDTDSITRQIEAGESLAFDRRGVNQKMADTAELTFAELAQRIEGVARLSGDVQWCDSLRFLGTDESSWPQRAQAVVFQEKRAFTLRDTLYLSELPSIPSGLAKSVMPGTTIRTYILLFHPGGPRPSVAEGSVAFDGEILGVVIGSRWNESFGVLGAGHDVKLFNADQKFGTLEFDFDTIGLSNDGHTLAFKLQAGAACDAVRIIVRESDGRTLD